MSKIGAGSTHVSATWRILHIEEDSVDALKLKLSLRYEMPSASKIDHAYDVQEATELLQQNQYDAVLAGGCSCCDTSAKEPLRQLIRENPSIPVLVVSADENAQAAVVAGQCGAKDFLFKSQLTGESLGAALRKAIVSCTPSGSDLSIDRRKDARYSVIAPAVIFPILSDSSPGREIPATTVDVGQSGISVLAERDADQVPDVCVVGVEGRGGVYRYATVQWNHRRLALPALRIGGRFLRRSDDPFHEANLTPRFDPQGLRFRCGLEPTALQEWTTRGILRPLVVDRVMVCPHCESLPTFRNGCPRCGSAKTQASRLIHHFACAHVAPLGEFGEDVLVCPKCLVQNLVVGADFEYLSGPCRCLECDWNDTQTVLIAECMKCGHRCPAQEAVEKDVLKYYVDRLDPLALLENRS